MTDPIDREPASPNRSRRLPRRPVIGAVALTLLATVVAGVIAFGGGGEPAASSETPDAAATGNGTSAAAAAESDLPRLSFELFDGTSASFADYRGRPLVINFWASWCPACVAELPDFQAVHEARGDAVTFLGLANADERSAAVALADSAGISYQLADDPDGDLFRSLGLFAMPSTVFVTADGRIHDVFGGQLNESALDERIDDLLAAS